jgi:hypothetical protein
VTAPDGFVTGVRFEGWTGGGGAIPGGWVRPPGAGGHFSASIDFCCRQFEVPGGSVAIESGDFDLNPAGRGATHATVVSGTVSFPSTLETDLGCGPGVSVVAVSLAGGGGIVACLDDLHGHNNAPPFPIWGTVRFP